MTAVPETSATRPAPAAHLRLRLWVRLLRAVRPIEAELRRRLDREFGVTLPKFDVMAALVRHPGGMNMTEVSRQLMVSNGNVTGIVDRLVAEELVTRVANAEDRRATFVRLTAKGLKLFEAMAAAHERWVDEILAGFGDERGEAMVGLLDALRAETRTGGRDR
jgi:DNA-binding MarR family transcriptional regulator